MVDGPVIPVSNSEQEESVRKAGGFFIPVMGHVPDTDVDTVTFHNLGTIAANAQATLPANGSLVPDAVYELKAIDDAQPATGSAPNLIVRPGTAAIDALTSATKSDPWLASVDPFYPIHLIAGQTKITIGNFAGSGKTARVFARRMK